MFLCDEYFSCQIDLTYSKGKIIMRVNQKTVSNNPPGPLTFFPSITLGLSPHQEYPGETGLAGVLIITVIRLIDNHNVPWDLEL